jgi:hypothetical protein
MLAFAGVTWIELSVAVVTFSVVVPDTLPIIAVMVVGPTATAVALPFDPAALLIVATDVAEEVHVTVVVRLCVELSV